MPRPALGKVAVGDRLLVIIPKYNNPYPEPVKADVTKVGRVWVEMEEVEQVRSFKRAWRLRLDTQHDGGDGNYHDRFVTPEQYAWEQEMAAVRATLFDAGLSFNNNTTPWRDEDRLLALADFIRAYDQEHQ